MIASDSAFTALRDPTRQDAVAALGETTGINALQQLRDAMLLSTTGRKILRTRPLINTQTIDFAVLSTLPKDTFGYAYHDFLVTYNVSPETRVDVKFVGDEELAYVMLRYRECHDFFHVLTGLPVGVKDGTLK
jgi:ubiquinone biosynthesis protein COQ4